MGKSIPLPSGTFHNYLNGHYPTNFFMRPTDALEIITITNTLNKKRSSGFDNISTIILCSTIDEIATPLAHIINQSFNTGIVSGNLKTAKVIPIFKSGDNTVLNNYRPISILPAISKVLEKLVCNRLVGFLEENDILYKHQYGFRSKHSTTHPVLKLIKDIADANDKNTKYTTLAVFIDLSKAFDTINHDIMLHKLQFYGIRGICNSWFANYLSNRKQFTEIGNYKSSHKYLTTGVPQGSILGPILFLIYINDIKNCTNKLSVLSYADDTTVYLSGPNTNEMIDIMNTELKKLYDWLCANRLSLNIKKTNCCIFSPSSKKYTCNKIVSLNNQTITQIGEQNKDDAITFLGIYIDRHLTWKKHINIICSKISKATFVINRVKHFFTTLRTKISILYINS